MGIPVKLEAFEGPLDLLLHLIDKNKVNIYDIPIVEITAQYMEYIHEMQRQDLNVMSEFLLMAATLLAIKSKMLLPKEINEEGEEEDPRQELVEQLLEYKLYKYMSYELRDMQADAAYVMYKEPTIPAEKRQNDRIDPIRSTFGTLEKEEVDMDEKWIYVESCIKRKRHVSFRELLGAGHTKMQMVITFLVILELMKMGKISIVQEHTFDDILIDWREDADDTPGRTFESDFT